MDNKKIEQIATRTEQAIKRKTAYALPDRPSEIGMQPEEIKKAFYSAITDKNDSIISEIKRIIEESNDVYDFIYSKFLNISQGVDNANKILATNKEGEVSPTEIVPVGDVKIQSGKDEDGNSYIEFVFPEEEGSE